MKVGKENYRCKFEVASLTGELKTKQDLQKTIESKIHENSEMQQQLQARDFMILLIVIIDINLIYNSL